MSSALQGHKVGYDVKFAHGGSRSDEMSSAEWNWNLCLQLYRDTG